MEFNSHLGKIILRFLYELFLNITGFYRNRPFTFAAESFPLANIANHHYQFVNFKNPIFAAMARILAFDYGTKRIGIAVTDPLQIIATGLDTIHPKDVVEFIKKYLLTEQVEAFVLGEPKQMDGTPSESYQHVKGFSTILKKNFPTIPQHWVDERFTSKMAHATIMQSGLKKTDRRDKERVDTISATIILQYFMEQNRL